MLASDTPAAVAISRVVSRATPRSRNSSSAAARIASRPPEGGRPRRLGGVPGIGREAYSPGAPILARLPRGASAGDGTDLKRRGLLVLGADEVSLPDQRERQQRSAERDDRSDQHQRAERFDETGAGGVRGETA